jgi:hypothetical protein
MAVEPTHNESHGHNKSHIGQAESAISLNSRKRVVEKDAFVKTLMALYTGNVEERKKIVFKL